VKNAFEQFCGGYDVAEKHFDAAYSWTLTFPSGSLLDHSLLSAHVGRSDLPKNANDRGIVESELFTSLWTPSGFREYSRDVIAGRAHLGTLDKNAFSGAFR
jgi:hypothetical protein